MAMGQKQVLQVQLFVTHAQPPQGLEHPFYAALERTRVAAGLARIPEQLCVPAYAAPMVRPSIPPGIYFRCPFVSYFE